MATPSQFLKMSDEINKQKYQPIGEPEPWQECHMPVRVKCDRCGEYVEGMATLGPKGEIQSISKFYLLRGPYTKLRRFSQVTGKTEEKICDKCMVADPEFVQ